jgi:P27 family predicted phage terminase small subunit
MSEDQKEGWRYAIANAPAGMLKLLDRAALTIWVGAESLHRKALIAVNQFGMVTKSKNQGVPMQNPYLPIVNKQAQIMLSAASELGFSPSSRSRVMVKKPGDGDDNPFNQFKRG